MVKKTLVIALMMSCFLVGAVSAKSPLFVIPMGSAEGQLSFFRGTGDQPDIGPGPLAANSKQVSIVDKVRKCLNTYDYKGRLVRQVRLPEDISHMVYDEQSRLFLLSCNSTIYCYTSTKGFEKYLKIPAQKKQFWSVIYSDGHGRLAVNGIGAGFVVEPDGTISEHPRAYVLLGPRDSVFEWRGTVLSQLEKGNVIGEWDLGKGNIRTLIPLGTDEDGRIFVAEKSGKAWRVCNLLDRSESFEVEFDTPFMVDDFTLKESFAVCANGSIVYISPDYHTCPVHVVKTK